MKSVHGSFFSCILALSLVFSSVSQATCSTWPLEILAKVMTDAAVSGAATWQISNGDTLLQTGEPALEDNACAEKECTTAVNDVLAKRPAIEAMGSLILASNLIGAGLSVTAAAFAATQWASQAFGLDTTCTEGKTQFNALQITATLFYAGSYIPTVFSFVVSTISVGITSGLLVNDANLLPEPVKRALVSTAISTAIPFVINLAQIGILGTFSAVRIASAGSVTPG